MKPVPRQRGVANSEGEEIRLSGMQCKTLIELAVHGSGGQFEMTALKELYRLGLVEVDASRKLCMTQHGKEVHRQLVKGKP